MIDINNGQKNQAKLRIDSSHCSWNQELLKREAIILEAIALHQPISEITRQLIETVETLIPNRIASFLFYDAKQNCLGSGQAIRLPSKYVEALEGLPLGPKAGCCGTAAYRKEPVIVKDIARDPLWEDFRDLAFNYGLRAAWSYPLLDHNGDLLGTFCCYSSTVSEPTERDLELTQVISRLASLAITQDQIRKESDQTKLALQESQKRYELAAEGAKVGVWEWNLETNEMFIAPNLKALLGYGDHEIPNRMSDWTQLVLPDDMENVNQAIEAYLAGRYSRLEVEHRMVHKNGTIIWFLARGKGQRDHNGKISRIIGSNTDITARKKAELAREKRDRYLHSLAEIQQQLITASQLTISVYQKIVNILGQTAEASRAYFFIAHGNEKQELLVSHRAEWCAEGIPAEIDNPELQNFPLNATPILFQAILSGKVYSNQVNDLPSPEQEILGSQGIQSILILPLFVNNQLFGIIGFDQCDYERNWEAIEINLLSWARNAIAIAQEKQQSQQALIESENKYRNIFENITQGIFQVTLDGQYLSANPFLTHLYGYNSPEELINRITNIPEQLYVDPQRRHQLVELTLQSGMIKNFESQVYCKKGKIIWISETQRAVYDQKGYFLYFEGVVEDITARKRAEDQLYYQAFHDELTQLLNRAGFIQHLEATIEAHEQEIIGYNYAVFFIDLDRFKIINDSFGHIIGDELLKQVASRLKNKIASHQLIARFGGDEFALLATEIVSEEDCCEIAKQLLDQFKQPFFLKENNYFIDASIGIALGNLSYETTEEILRDADAAMYEAKAKKQGYAFFKPEIRERILSRLLLENDLEGAINRGEFQLRYQPLVYLETNEIYGFEVLLRWFHPRNV